MSSIHDQVRRTVMAHCFKRLRELPEDDATLILRFYDHVRTAAARAKETRSGGSSRKGGATCVSSAVVGTENGCNLLPPLESDGSNVVFSTYLSRFVASEDERSIPLSDDVPHQAGVSASNSFFSALPSSSSYSNENSNASQPLPTRDARALKVSSLAAELRRMGDLVYGLQLSVLHLNDLCVLGHILNMKRATEYILDTIADVESENASPVAEIQPAKDLLMDEGHARPSGADETSKDVSTNKLTAATAKKRRRPLSKNVMVAELDDYHRTQQPVKRERRSAFATEIIVPSAIAPKSKGQQKPRSVDEQPKPQAPTTQAKNANLEKKKEARALEDNRVKCEELSPKEKKIRKESQNRVASRSLSAPTVGQTVITGQSVLKKILPPSATVLASNRLGHTFAAPDTGAIRQLCHTRMEGSGRGSGGMSLLASLGLGISGDGSPAQPKRFAISACDFDEEDPMVDATAFDVTVSASKIHGELSRGAASQHRGELFVTQQTQQLATYEEEYEEYEEIEEVEEIVEETEDDDGLDTSQPPHTEELNVVNGGAFKHSSASLVKPASYDFSTDEHQRDAADFLLKQVVLQGTLSTAKGAELLIKKRIPFVPIDPLTGQGAVGVPCESQSATGVAERFVNCVFKQFHKQEKVAYDHGVAYIY